MKRLFATLLLLPALIASPACGDYDSTGPAEPTGTYSATQFTTTANGVTVDQLAQGVTLTITLSPDGMIAGSIVVPSTGTPPLTLNGTWSRRGTEIAFHGSPLTFLDSLPFRLTSSQLQGDGAAGPTTFHLILRR